MSARKLFPELVRPLFSNVHNLASLDNLLRASPAASHQFKAFPTSIFEYVLSSRQIHEHTCALIRIVAMVRSSALPPSVHDTLTLTDFIRQETTSYRYWPPTWTYPHTRLSSGTGPTVSASTLLSILDTQREIEALVAGCLKFYLKRFNALQPYHLVDPAPQFKPDDSDGHDRLFLSAWGAAGTTALPHTRFGPADLGRRATCSPSFSGVCNSSTT